MTTWDIVLVIVAALLAVFAFVYEQYRFKSGRSVGVGMMAGGLAAALAAYVALRHFLHHLLAHLAHGHHRWATHGLVPGLLVIAVAALIGYWVWALDRNRYHKS